MRVRIIFKLRNKGVSLPFHHQHLLTEFVTKMLSGKDFSNIPYNFSGLKGQTRVSRNGLFYYSNRVTLVLSTLDKDFVDFFLNRVFQNTLLEIGNLILTPEAVEEELQPTFANPCKYICISPLVALMGKPEANNSLKDFITPDSEQFSDMLYESTMSRMERSGLFTAADIASFYQFQIMPDMVYLERIKQESKKFARIYTLPEQQPNQKVEVRGYTFPFALYAHPKVHEFIFNCGFGEATEFGYGMLDLANADPLARAVPYMFPKVVEAEKTANMYSTVLMNKQKLD